MANIQDGTGEGFYSRVDENNRMHTHAVTVTEVVHASEQGGAFNINTGQIPFTGAGTLIYLRNDELRDFVIEAIALGNDGGATYTARPSITLIRNPTGGDLISDQTPVDMLQNRDFGSSKVFSSAAYKGKSGGTVSGGDDIALLQASTAGRDFYTINLVLPVGKSIGVSYSASISSGSASIYAAIVGYLRDPAGQDN